MRLRAAIPVSAILWIGGAACMAQVSGGASIQNFVLAGDRAYGLVMPVQFCCGPTVRRAVWSSDSSYVLLERLVSKATKEDVKRAITGDPAPVPPPPTVRICFWNKTTEKLTEVVSFDPKRMTVEHQDWLIGADVALAYLREEWTDRANDTRVFRLSLVELNARTGAYRVLWTSTDESSDLEYSVSPKLPFAVVYGTPPKSNSRTGDGPVVQVYRPGSGLGPPIALPEGALPEAWTADGKKLVLGTWHRTPGKRAHKEIAFDPFTGKTSPAPEIPAELRQVPGYTPPAGTIVPLHEFGPRYQRVGDLRLQPEFWGPEPRTMRPVYLAPMKEAPPPASGRKASVGVLVTAEAEFAQISPAKDAVLYVTRGVALVRPMLEMDLAAYQKAELESAKNRAKQVALGMLMYAGDYDDMAVPNASDWTDLVEPYLKDKSLFEGFEYTFAGGLITGVANPATTELGYIPVSGGRVVAYLDGHVNFVPSPAASLGEVRRPWEDRALRGPFAFDSG